MIAVCARHELVGDHLEDLEADDLHSCSCGELIAHRTSRIARTLLVRGRVPERDQVRRPGLLAREDEGAAVALVLPQSWADVFSASREMSASADTGPLRVDIAATNWPKTAGYASQLNTTAGVERSTGPWCTASTLVPSGSRT